MSKRFTATDKWDHHWFCELSDCDKLFWFYLLDKCNHAGIWQVNWPLAKFHIKGAINHNVFKDRVQVLSPDKWLIPQFVPFQYGKLSPESKVHSTVITLLEKEGVSIPYVKGIDTLKDKDRDIDTNKVKEKDKDQEQDNLHEPIPEWVDKQAWKDFTDMRKRLRKPLTEAAIKLTISELEKLKAQGHDPKMVLNQSVMNSWQGIFPLRDDFKRKGRAGCPPIPGKYDGIGKKV